VYNRLRYAPERASERATVSLAFTQKMSRRKVKGKCVSQTKANKRKHCCKCTVTNGTLYLSAHPGSDKVA
jgi:hypothetical protein